MNFLFLKKRHLQTHLVLLATLSIAITFTIDIVHEISKQTETSIASITHEMTTLARSMATASETSLLFKDFDALEDLLKLFVVFPDILNIQVINTQGKIIGKIIHDKKGVIQTRFLDKKIPLPRSKEQSVQIKKDYMVIWHPIERDELLGWIRLKISLDELSQVKKHILYNGFITGSMVIGANGILLFIFLKHPTNVIQRIINFSKRLSQERGIQMTKETNIIEINELIDSLNTTSKQLHTQELKIKNAMDARNEFTSTVSHELRTPLAISKEALSLLLRGKLGDIPEKQKEILMMASSNIDRLGLLINDILDVSKIEAGQMTMVKETVDIIKIVKDTYESWKLKANAKKINLSLAVPESPLNFCVDKMKFLQILSNLLSNAIKFTPENGKIKISIKEDSQNIKFSVKDTGCGISRENIPKIFKKFQQVNRTYGPGSKGTGLGLNIVKSLVELHEGHVYVKSKMGEGSNFYFTLPKGKNNEEKNFNY